MNMKVLFTLISLVIFAQFQAYTQTEFIIEPTQSMLMTGKGPGQDATINPFEGEDCYALVQNIGKRPFSVRIQQSGTILNTITVSKGENKKIKLLAGQELYLDPLTQGIAKASVDYASMKAE